MAPKTEPSAIKYHKKLSYYKQIIHQQQRLSASQLYKKSH